MSSTSLILFCDNKISQQVSFKNAWGGSARIWSSLYDKYPPPGTSSWMDSANFSNDGPFWKIESQLTEVEKAVFRLTFDRALVKREHFQLMAGHLRSFNLAFPVQGANHLPAWACAFEEMPPEIEHVGLHTTSCGENLWLRYDPETDGHASVDLREVVWESVYGGWYDPPI